MDGLNLKTEQTVFGQPAKTNGKPLQANGVKTELLRKPSNWRNKVGINYEKLSFNGVYVLIFVTFDVFANTVAHADTTCSPNRMRLLTRGR